ncbi:MAG: dTMP kinase [Streptosporangiales bacterium]|nr:dTMP kinase [Streptosporangiales bacterium]
MSETAAGPSAGVIAAHDLRGLLRITPFRRLWVALGLSSLGDWLGFLAVTALAARYGGENYALANFAVGGVLILRMLPSLLLGPVAGALADRFDRRITMVVSDVVRFGMYASIPLVNTWWWLFVATLVTECASIFWTPAKEATVPNIVPRSRLEAANQLGLVTTYGTAPIAAGIFTLLATVSSLLGRTWVEFFKDYPLHMAMYVNAVTFLFAAYTVLRLKGIPAPGGASDGSMKPGVFRQIAEGWAFVGRTRMVRGLIFGMLGAFAAGGAVIAVGRVFVASMYAGDAGYGVLFGAVFVGMAVGMFTGPRLLRGFSRRRLFGLCLAGAGVGLLGIGLIENLVLVLLLTLVVGSFAGMAWVIGYTLIGLEVDDAVRGRTFAFLQMMVRIVLIAVLAVAPLIAGAIGTHELRPFDFLLHFDGSHAVILLAAVLMLVMGIVSFRQMDDRTGVPVLRELADALRGKLTGPQGAPRTGVFVAFEGGDGAGKSTQVQLLTRWLEDQGQQVVATREPGNTPIGAQLRAMLLDPGNGGLDARAEAMLYAADRAQHVAEVIRPALARGAVVVTDRYADSSRAYQGAGRELAEEDIGRLSTWATGGLVPDLTVVLDLPPDVAASRRTAAADRLEQESLDFHERVRRSFLDLAGRDPDRYLVVDATHPPEQVAEQIRTRLGPLLARAGTAHSVPTS